LRGLQQDAARSRRGARFRRGGDCVMAGEEQNEQQPVEQTGNIVARPNNARRGDRSHRGRSWLRWSGRRAPTEIEAKRLELLREVLPRLSRVAYLASKDDRDWQ